MMRHISPRLALCGLAILGLASVASPPAQSAPKMAGKMSKAKPKPKASKGPKMRTLAGGLRVQDLRVGRGATATDGKTLTMHYRGTLTSGKQFDASYDRGEPFSFTLGSGQVIAGWDQGIKGMKVGGKRKLIIPAALGYGSQAMGDSIPANSTLVFVVELLKVS